MNTKKKTKLLTISLLCCGRQDTTERCLKSLMPIRKAIDSEIQVVDTGCNKETRAVIEKYADEVFEFKWCNDFAAARNFQLDQANGKMFLYLDDDEFFLDCKYIIDFFKQPDCTSYNIGGYYQRNYLDFEAKEYEDIEVIRMCSVTPETHFVGKVHEYIEPSYGNAMFMDAQAGHYGYVYTTKEENFKHSMRNIPLLKDMMVEDPDNLRWPYQLAQEYRAIGYHQELYDLCRSEFDKSFSSKDEDAIRYRGTFAAGIAASLMELGKEDDCLKFYREQMKKDDIMLIPKAKLATYGAQAMYSKGLDDECIDTVNFYLDVMEKHGKNRGMRFLQTGLFTFDVFNENHSNMMYCYLMASAMHKDDFGPLARYYRKITWESKVIRISKGYVTTLLLKACQYGGKREISKALDKFFTREGFKNILEDEIEVMNKGLSEIELGNLRKAFTGTVGQKELFDYIDIRLMERNLAKVDEYTTYHQVLNALIDYANLVLEWKDLHKASAEEPEAYVSAPELVVANGIAQFVELSEKEPARALTSLKNVVGTRSILDNALTQLARTYGDYQKVLAAKADNPDKFNEMYSLEEALLKQISDLDAAGQSAAAQSTYQQLVGILQANFGVNTLHM